MTLFTGHDRGMVCTKMIKVSQRWMGYLKVVFKLWVSADMEAGHVETKCGKYTGRSSSGITEFVWFLDL